jgi:hypothetical protein
MTPSAEELLVHRGIDIAGVLDLVCAHPLVPAVRCGLNDVLARFIEIEYSAGSGDDCVVRCYSSGGN